MKDVFGLTANGIRRTAETNRRVLGELPATGRRTRRVYPPGSSSGGVTPLIEFTLSEVNCCTLTATGTVRRVLCSGSGVSEGDTICLRDDSQLGHFFGGAHSPDFPAAWNGVRGWAAKMVWHSGEGGIIGSGSGSDCEDLCPIGSGSGSGSDDVCVWTAIYLMDTANYC